MQGNGWVRYLATLGNSLANAAIVNNTVVIIVKSYQNMFSQQPHVCFYFSKKSSISSIYMEITVMWLSPPTGHTFLACSVMYNK